MSDAVVLALIGAAVSVFSASASLVSIWMIHSFRMQADKEALITSAKIESIKEAAHETKATIEVLEKNTNSIKDALIDSTRRESLLIGHQAGMKDAAVSEALRAEGRVEARTPPPRTAPASEPGALAHEIASEVKDIIRDTKLSPPEKEET